MWNRNIFISNPGNESSRKKREALLSRTEAGSESEPRGPGSPLPSFQAAPERVAVGGLIIL